MILNHQVSLEDPVLKEYEQARRQWMYERQESTEEELKTANCDYDSETGKRYSEDESEEESSSDETVVLTAPSDNQYSSDSAMESSPINLLKKKRNLKRKEHSNMVEKQVSNLMEKEISNLKITVEKLESSMQKGNNEIITLKSEIKDLKAVKSTTDETEEVDKRLTNLNTLIEQETEARIFFNKDLEKRCSQLESPKENEIISKSENLAGKVSATNQET